MTSPIQRAFTTATNYTYPDTIEVSGGKARLKDLTPADSTCGATFSIDKHLNNWSKGVVTNEGGGVVSGGMLALLISTSAKFAALNNADFTQKGTSKFKIKPNWNGNPSVIQYLISIAASPSTANYITVYQHTNGTLYFYIGDKDNAVIVNAALGNWVPVLGTEYIFEVHIDIDSGNSYVKINGELFGTVQTGIGERTNTCTYFYFGGDNAGVGTPNFHIDNLMIYNATVDEGTGYSIPETKYTLTNPTIEWNEHFFATLMLNLTVTKTEPGDDKVKHSIIKNGTRKYWNGSSVEDSSGYTQSNDKLELINAVLESFTNNNRFALKFVNYLHSENGSTTPELDLLSFEINASLNNPTLTTLINLEGFFYLAGQPREGLKIYIRPYLTGRVNNEIFQVYEWDLLDITDSRGHISGFFYFDPNAQYWELKVGCKRYKIEGITDTPEVNLKDLNPTLVED